MLLRAMPCYNLEPCNLEPCNLGPWDLYPVTCTLEPWNPGTLELWNLYPGTLYSGTLYSGTCTLEPVLWNPVLWNHVLWNPVHWNPCTLEPCTLEPWNPVPWNPVPCTLYPVPGTLDHLGYRMVPPGLPQGPTWVTAGFHMAPYGYRRFHMATAGFYMATAGFHMATAWLPVASPHGSPWRHRMAPRGITTWPHCHITLMAPIPAWHRHQNSRDRIMYRRNTWVATREAKNGNNGQ